MRALRLGPSQRAHSFFFSAEVSGIYTDVLRPKVMGLWQNYSSVFAESRIRTDSEIGNGIEIEFSNQFRPNPGDANMSFQLVIQVSSDHFNSN